MQRDFSSTDRNFNEPTIKEELSSSFFSNDPMNNIEALNHQIPDFDPKKRVFKHDEFDGSPGKDISECSMTYSISNPTRTNTLSQKVNSNNMRLARKNSQGNSKSIDLLRVKEFKSDDGFNISDVNDSQFQNLDSRRESYMPLEMAKNQLKTFEEEMRHVSDKHSKLISDLENNYRTLDNETEHYYNDILEKWKEVIKEKVFKYKQQYDSILLDKNQTLEELQAAIQELEKQNASLVEEKDIFMKKYHDEAQKKFEDQRNKIINDLNYEFQDHMNRAEQEKEALYQEIEDLKAKMQNLGMQAQKDIDDLEEFNNRLFEEKSAIESELKRKDESYAAEAASIYMNFMIAQVELNAKIEEKENVIVSYCTTLETLNSSIAQMTDENSDLLNKYTLLAREYDEKSKNYEDKIQNLKTMMKIEKPKDCSNPDDKSSTDFKQETREKSVEEKPKVDTAAMQGYIRQLEENFEKKCDLKKKIADWLAAFKKKEGRNADANDKNPIKHLYMDYNNAKKQIKDIEDLMLNVDVSNKENSAVNNTILESKIQNSKSMSPRKVKMGRHFLQSSHNITNTSINASFDANVSHINMSQLNTSHTDQSFITQNTSFYHSSGLPMGNTNDIKAAHELKFLREENAQLRSSLNMSSISKAEDEEFQKFKTEIAKLNIELQKMQAENAKLQQEKKQLKEKLISVKRTKLYNNENSILGNDDLERKSIDTDRLKGNSVDESRLKELELKTKKNEEDYKKQIQQIVSTKDSIIMKLEQEIKSLTTSQEKNVREIKSYSTELSKIINERDELRNQRIALETRIKFEITERKKLQNNLADIKGKVRVFCRVRPLLPWEVEKGFKPSLEQLDDSNIKMETKNGQKIFPFDSCFFPDASQEAVFEESKRLIQSAVDGYNVCIFAYGQTGSGKTYTMQGTNESPGITPRAVEELFSLAGQLESTCEVSISCNMLELYMDTLIDLLSKGKKKEHLDIKEDVKGMVYVQNITNHPVTNKEQLNRLIKMGIQNRKTSTTAMNEDSSRSHLIINITIEVINKHTDQVNIRTIGKLSLVDLAGSERTSKAKTNPKQLTEAKAINKSLTALIDVFYALSSDEKNRFVPYRNNRLTMLMKDFLGGTAKTLMFVNVNPADYNVDETQASLFYGIKVKTIVNDCVKNVESREFSKLKETLKLISEERDNMKNILAKNGINYKYQTNFDSVFVTPSKSDDDDEKYEEGPIYNNFEK